MRIDRMDNQRLAWSSNYADPNSPDYQQLQWEANKAVITSPVVFRPSKTV